MPAPLCAGLEKARGAACLSNVKQMGLAWMMYAQDYDERFPVADPSPDANGVNAVTMAMPGELPESPGAVHAQELGSEQRMQGQSAAAEPQSPASQSPQSEPGQPPSQTVQPAQTAPQQPVGTAAAETSKASGVAASQPAGVAIAPAKQRRVRLIVIRVGAILGAGAAVGTVVALTQATPSKPPGAH